MWPGLGVDGNNIRARFGSRYGSAGAIIRCTSKIASVWRRRAFTTAGPMVIFGTKCPSMTSTCTQSAPAAMMARVSSPNAAKSAERIEGATRTGLRIFGLRLERFCEYPAGQNILRLDQHQRFRRNRFIDGQQSAGLAEPGAI